MRVGLLGASAFFLLIPATVLFAREPRERGPWAASASGIGSRSGATDRGSALRRDLGSRASSVDRGTGPSSRMGGTASPDRVSAVFGGERKGPRISRGITPGTGGKGIGSGIGSKGSGIGTFPGAGGGPSGKPDEIGGSGKGSGIGAFPGAGSGPSGKLGGIGGKGSGIGVLPGAGAGLPGKPGGIGGKGSGIGVFPGPGPGLPGKPGGIGGKGSGIGVFPGPGPGLPGKPGGIGGKGSGIGVFPGPGPGLPGKPGGIGGKGSGIGVLPGIGPGLPGKPGGIGFFPGPGPGKPGHPGHPGWIIDHHHGLNAHLSHRVDIRAQLAAGHFGFMAPLNKQWHSWAVSPYFRHHPWYAPWNHHWDPYWRHLWYRYPALIGLPVTYWAFNSAFYPMGLWAYTNPYWVATGPTVVYDYSQPVVVASDAQAEPPQPALDLFEQARNAFYQGDYPLALRLVDEALKNLLNDAAAHQFRALCLFALADYRNAAATLNAVLAVSPGWDWATMVGLYPNVETYTVQLRRLERYIDDHPEAGDARFVLAYQYLTAGHTEAGVDQLREVVRLVPNDTVAQQLLQMLSPPAPPAAPAPAAEPGPALGNVQVKLEDLLGTWNAQGADGVRFELTLNQGGEFTWRYTRGNDTQSMRGAFAVEGETLAMQPETGGVLVAEITPPDATGFTFKPVGSSEVSQTLKFTR
jgi:tetratricopeptide (TPR) repeat protein